MEKRDVRVWSREEVHRLLVREAFPHFSKAEQEGILARSKVWTFTGSNTVELVIHEDKEQSDG